MMKVLSVSFLLVLSCAASASSFFSFGATGGLNWPISPKGTLFLNVNGLQKGHQYICEFFVNRDIALNIDVAEPFGISHRIEGNRLFIDAKKLAEDEGSLDFQVTDTSDVGAQLMIDCNDKT